MASYGAGKYARAGEGGAVAVQGFAQLSAALARIADGTQDELKARIRAVGERVALVAAGNAPRGDTGQLQHSIRVAVAGRGASVYSSSLYGGAQNVGAWVKGRGPHISRTRASHYMDRAVDQTAPWVVTELDSVMEWVTTTFTEG